MRAPVWGAAAVAALMLLTAGVIAQQPDARQMSGIPLPSGDVPAGSVSVRLVRGELTNVIADHPVELHAGDKTQRARTDKDGRAVFTGVLPGLPVHVYAEVDGEKLESQTFSLTPDVGSRLVLVAGGGAAPAGGSPGAALPAAVPGDVVFGGDSRIQIEFEDDVVEVFYLFEVVNTTNAPVTPKQELVFELPEEAEQAAMLEGSSTQASIKGRVVTMSGPFAPGVTPVQLAYSLSPGAAARTLTQQLPIPWARVQVIMTRAGAAAMSSPQFGSANPMPGDGQNFIVGLGGPLASSQPLSVAFTGLPSRSRLGRNVALIAGVAILLWGIYAAYAGGRSSAKATRRAQLLERRDKLMADLVRLEQQARSGGIDASRHASRRAELVAQLERIYGELDDQSGTPGSEGLPA